MKKAIFLDKDGTLIPDIPYNVDPDKISLQDGVAGGLQLLRDAGFRLYVISNQSGVARGKFEEAQLEGVWKRLQQLLETYHLQLDGFYYCPHHPEGSRLGYATSCACRKPAPGLLLQAADEHDLDLTRSWMIGDILNDVAAGNRAGCRTVLIDNGGETEWIPGPYRTPAITAPDLLQAAKAILQTIHEPELERL